MDLLNIEHIHDEDLLVVGRDLVYLARLKRDGFLVSDGVVVFPPEVHIKSSLNHFNFKDREIFESSLVLLKKEIFKIPPPEELVDLLNKKKIEPNEAWRKLLEVWIEKLRSKIWNEGINLDMSLGLMGLPIFFTHAIKAYGIGYFDEDLKEVIVKTDLGHLTLSQVEEIKNLVMKGNKKLVFPHAYNWVIESNKSSKIKITKISEYTQPIYEHKHFVHEEQVKKSIAKSVNDKKISVTKVYINLGRSLECDPNCDGVFIEADDCGDFDEMALKIVESAASFPSKEVMFMLSDRSEKIRGCLRLIHDHSLLEKDANAYLFARNKKQLLNVNLIVPFIRSVNEFLQIKRDLAALGISRKGSLKVLAEFGVPENVLNIDDYLTAGVDGIIFDLDELAGFLGGYEIKSEDHLFYKQQVNALLKLIDQGVTRLKKEKLPFYITGELSLNDEVLSYFIKHGVKAVIVDRRLVDQTRDIIIHFEKKLIQRVKSIHLS